MVKKCIFGFIIPFILTAAQPVRLLLHADDVGMSHSTNLAVLPMLDSGAVSSASIMMPCPWVSQIADYARRHPKGPRPSPHPHQRVETHRLAPVAPVDRVRGLLDSDGYMWRSVEETATHATPLEVEIELRAQIEKAKAMGIKFTHFDTHMGTLYARPDYFQVFEKLGREYNVPILRFKYDKAALEAEVPPVMVEYLGDNEPRFQQQGMFRLDSLLTNPARGIPTEAERRAAYHQTLRTLKPGVTMIILHPALLNEELRSITGTHRQRDLDYRIFMEEQTRALIRSLNIQLVGWRDLASTSTR